MRLRQLLKKCEAEAAVGGVRSLNVGLGSGC